MKIAIIGNGIIGSISSIYLASKGYEVDCIGPDLETAKKELGIDDSQLNTQISKSNGKNISPKFLRKDLSINKFISDNYFIKQTKNFFSLEIANEMGLAKFWGANLAIKGLNEYIDKLNLNEEELKFIYKNIPKIDVHDYYNKQLKIAKGDSYWKALNLFTNKKQDEIQSSVLSIFEDECDINNLPNNNFSKAIFASEPINLKNCSRIRGRVERIDFSSKKDNSLRSIFINNGEKVLERKYNFIFLACGSIGSYRILMNSLPRKKLLKKNDKIKHHPMISSLTFIPHLPYPKKHFGMSNLDLKLKVDSHEIFINFHPFESFLKAKFNNTNIKNFLFTKYFQFVLEILSKIPFSPLWILRRTYIAAIYLNSNFSSSYIKYQNDKISINGGLIKNFDKYIRKYFWKKICTLLRTKQIYNLFINPIKINIGADFHYSSTLVKYTDNKGKIKLGNKKTNLIVLDSSSSKILPTPNPTFYFLCRAIKLLRKF